MKVVHVRLRVGNRRAFSKDPTFEHENVVCGFIPHWIPVTGSVLMDQFVVRILYTSWGKVLRMTHEGVARITCLIFLRFLS